MPCSAIRVLAEVTLLLWDGMPCELRLILRWFLDVASTLGRQLAGTGQGLHWFVWVGAFGLSEPSAESISKIML